jgi:hypothetical protein
MTFELVPTPEDFERKEGSQLHNLLMCMNEKEISIALGKVGTHFFMNSYLESTNPYYMMSVRWYAPCSAKYRRGSSIFRILSVELWVVLIISIVFAAITSTLVGRNSCTSEWQEYKTVTSSLTNFWAVILGVIVNHATHTVPTFVVPRLVMFFSGIQHSVPSISYNVSY